MLGPAVKVFAEAEFWVLGFVAGNIPESLSESDASRVVVSGT